MGETFLNKSGVEALADIKVEQGTLLINWLGQAGFLFKTPKGAILCIDPYLSNSVEKHDGAESRRMWFPSFSMENFKPDAVICTHDHLDHTDPETLPLIASYSNAGFFGPEESCEHMLKMNINPARITKVEVGKEYSVKDAEFKPVYARHTSGSIGVIVAVDRINIYITGDTEYCSELLDISHDKPDLLITCINGKYGNLDADEALKVADGLGVKAVIPMHYGLLPSNTVNPQEFVRKCSEKGISCFALEEEKNYICSKSVTGEMEMVVLV